MVVIVFDMDGVLTDSVEIMFNSVNFALEELKKPTISFEKFTKSFNPRDWRSSFTGFGIDYDTQAEKFKNLYLSYKIEELGKLIPPKNLFNLLKTKNAKLFLLSAGSEIEVVSFLNDSKIIDFFDTILFGKSRKAEELVKISKSNSKDKVYFIGDSLSDLECSKEARKSINNLIFIGVTHSRIKNQKIQLSINSRKDFENEVGPNDFIIDKLSDIFEIIPELKIRQ